MAQQCPLLFRQVDATVTRINTLFIIFGVIGFLVSKMVAILIFLSIDFILRLSGRKHLSPIQIVSLWIQKKFAIPSKMEDAGAKRLAAVFALGFLIAMVVFHLISFTFIVYIIAGIYLICALLDLFFGFCIACHIYHLAKKIYPKGFE
jgi:hypothetical protein